MRPCSVGGGASYPGFGFRPSADSGCGFRPSDNPGFVFCPFRAVFRLQTDRSRTLVAWMAETRTRDALRCFGWPKPEPSMRSSIPEGRNLNPGFGAPLRMAETRTRSARSGPPMTAERTQRSGCCFRWLKREPWMRGAVPDSGGFDSGMHAAAPRWPQREPPVCTERDHEEMGCGCRPSADSGCGFRPLADPGFASCPSDNPGFASCPSAYPGFVFRPFRAVFRPQMDRSRTLVSWMAETRTRGALCCFGWPKSEPEMRGCSPERQKREPWMWLQLQMAKTRTLGAGSDRAAGRGQRPRSGQWAATAQRAAIV